MVGVGVVQIASVDGMVDHRVGNHYDIFIRLCGGDGLEVLVQPAYALLGIDHRVAAVGNYGQNMISAYAVVPAFVLFGHRRVAYFGGVEVRAEALGELLGFLIGVHGPFFPDVVVAHGVGQGDLAGIEHVQIEPAPVVDLGVFARIPGGAVHQVAHHDHSVEAAEAGGKVAFLLQCAAEFAGGDRLVSVYVRVADGGQIEHNLPGVEVTAIDDGAEQQGRHQQ